MMRVLKISLPLAFAQFASQSFAICRMSPAQNALLDFLQYVSPRQIKGETQTWNNVDIRWQPESKPNGIVEKKFEFHLNLKNLGPAKLQEKAGIFFRDLESARLFDFGLGHGLFLEKLQGGKALVHLGVHDHENIFRLLKTIQLTDADLITRVQFYNIPNGEKRILLNAGAHLIQIKIPKKFYHYRNTGIEVDDFIFKKKGEHLFVYQQMRESLDKLLERSFLALNQIKFLETLGPTQFTSDGKYFAVTVQGFRDLYGSAELRSEAFVLLWDTSESAFDFGEKAKFVGMASVRSAFGEFVRGMDTPRSMFFDGFLTRMNSLRVEKLSYDDGRTDSYILHAELAGKYSDFTLVGDDVANLSKVYGPETMTQEIKISVRNWFK
jgi:hypothetical protein